MATASGKPKKNPQAILWIAQHRNALTEIAKQCQVTTQFVSYVLHGQRRSGDGRVERLLRQWGAPVKRA